MRKRPLRNPKTSLLLRKRPPFREPKVCPFCHALNDPQSLICTKCGKPLK
jgi:predicted amidophosphoribosyltransferase